MKKITSLLLGIMALAMVSCTSDETVPEGVLPKETMAKVLLKIHLKEAELEVKQIQKDTANVMFDVAEKEIYTAAGTTHEQFKKSYLYYSDNQAQFDEIYTIVLDSLNILEAKQKSK